jgi:transcriptional regulator with XRE-family HTH domain
MQMDGETRAYVARNVADLRNRQGWSQAELGKRAGVSQRTISDIENALHKSPGLDTLEGLAAALRVPLWALFLPEIPTDLSSLRRADRLTATYLAIGEDGKRTLDGIAEAEARYHAIKLPK